ncbi:hypothetical protein C4552_02745 [Candidatus Parcubacteria bacterium]|nr:MAG: hypothetical protein C4552_02745 [Candidatus Parcubacteria bacterium]
MAKTVLLTTTIRVPTFIDEVCANIAAHRHTDLAWYIIGDRKTPPETKAHCETVSVKYNIPITYVDLDDQRKRLAEFPELWAMVPENTPVRRLLWHLVAYQEGCETLISVDDDNFVTDIDFVGAHKIAGTSPTLPLVSTETGWWNVYETLREEKGIPIFPRGFPWGQRQYKLQQKSVAKQAGTVIVNNGLVLEDPDQDAISRLFWPVRIVGMDEAFQPNFGLAPGTWCAFNNQNTAFAREIIPAYYTPVSTGRNADIWTSFFVCKLAEHLGGIISYGYPLVKQFRNPHDFWKDLEDELVNDRGADRFVKLLRSIPLAEKSYRAATAELAAQGLERAKALTNLPQAEKEMMEGFFREYLVWHKHFAGLPA